MRQLTMAALLALCGCGGRDATTPTVITAGTIDLRGPAVREGVVGSVVADVILRVTVTGPDEVRIAANGGGQVDPATIAVRTSGEFPLRWTLGPTVGEQRLNAELVASRTSASLSIDARARPAVVPTIDRTVWATGFSNPWDLAWLPDGSALITERGGAVIRRTAAGAQATLARPADVVVSGEGGLLGLAVDPEFTTNRFVYTCFSSRAGGATDNRLVRWRVAPDHASLTDRVDIVTGLPWANGGRHSGCRPRFGPDGALWIGTGDAAVGSTPQALRSLGGKVLRVTRDGQPAPGNPTIATADPRIYSYGHRNVQGVAFQPGTNATFTAEHGPGTDDEVNRLEPGMNAGWDPVPGYNESVPMTDTRKFPTAVPAIWSSGAPARGTSGAAFLRGTNWSAWNGALVIGQLSGQRLGVLTFGANGRVATTTYLFDGLGVRLRTPVLGPDSALYVTTDLGNGQGQIWRLVPR